MANDPRWEREVALLRRLLRSARRNKDLGRRFFYPLHIPRPELVTSEDLPTTANLEAFSAPDGLTEMTQAHLALSGALGERIALPPLRAMNGHVRLTTQSMP
jgi:hypothetical protein